MSRPGLEPSGAESVPAHWEAPKKGAATELQASAHMSFGVQTAAPEGLASDVAVSDAADDMAGDTCGDACWKSTQTLAAKSLASNVAISDGIEDVVGGV